MSKKKIIGIIGSIVLAVVIGVVGFNYVSYLNSEEYKMGKQERLADELLRDYKDGSLPVDTALFALESMKNNTEDINLKRYIENNIAEIEETEEEAKEEIEEIAREIEEASKPKIIVSANKHYSAGSQEVRIKVDNVGDEDISYLRIDFFEVTEDGQTVGSGWTNNKGAVIRAGSTAYIETYYDYYMNGTNLEFEVSDVRYRD